jgi:hypothetical protein
MRTAEINYGNGLARIYGDFPEDGAKRAFMRHANDMFGIRKSIMDVEILKVEEIDTLPEPWGKMQGAAFVLEHNCGGPGWVFKDLAVWNDKGEKIKSEWD